jgi:agmatine deiminase
MFRYTAAGQGGGQSGQRDTDSVQETLAVMAEDAAITFRETDLLNDGGNFVDDYTGNVVVSRKFLRDNKLTEARGREAIRKLTMARYIAFIDADEQVSLGFANETANYPKLAFYNKHAISYGYE